MSWIQKLYETYERCVDLPNSGEESAAITPLYHLKQQAHIEMTIDGDGNFRRASVVGKEYTVIPATEKSATARTRAIVAHPLCDHVKYCAGDYSEGKEKTNKYFEKYREQLGCWHQCHPKADAIFKYIEKKTVLSDLIKEGVMPVDADGCLQKEWESKQNKPALLKQLTPEKKIYKPQNALIRWRVEIANDPVPEVWKDKKLQDAWLAYCTAKEASKTPELCMITGIKRVLADKHPNKIRNGKDGAKLISNKKTANSDFIYLGRFLSVDQAAGVGIEVSQKAHGALSWLIGRQGFSNGDQVIVAWSVDGKDIPNPFKNSADMFGLDVGQTNTSHQYQGDFGQTSALRLNNYIRGYRTNLGSTDGIVVMGLDSASKGRMAITYYRELTGSEFLDRVEAWHKACAWAQNYSKKIKFVGTPSPKDIAEAAYGRQLVGESGKKLSKATVERLLPCIIDGQPIPRDLVELSVNRAANRAGYDKWEFDKQLKTEVNAWEKNLGIACALFKGYNKDRSYQMTLETNRTSRDYLYGRLLAIAENIEGRALHIAGEERDTNAAKLMQRFADHPYSTWRTIEIALTPYKTRLRSKRAPFLRAMELLLDEVTCALGDAYINDSRLTGEFLLGYHCQRQALRPPAKKDNPDQPNEIQEGE